MGEMKERKTDVKERAKVLRQRLKTEFPKTKFSVRIDRYSMGNSIHVRWMDGPASKKIEPIVAQFEEIDRCDQTGEILSGGNRYAFAERSYSSVVKNKVETEIWEKFVPGTFSSVHDYQYQREVFQALQARDF